MPNLRDRDIEQTEYIGRDAMTIIEGELRQFDRRFDQIKRYVENIVTGAFYKVKMNVDLGGVIETKEFSIEDSRN